MLDPYRRILRVPGAWKFSLAGFFARLPISMLSLGLVLLISQAYGSYALAGSVTAVFLLANAGGAVVHGRLIDRLGQRRVLLVAVACFAIAMTLLAWAVQDHWPRAAIFAFAVVAGAAHPQIGSAVRARWSYAVTSASDKQTAYAFESVVDEAIFVSGPTLVTFLATWVHPLLGLATAVTSGVVGTVWFASQTSTQPPVLPRVRDDGSRASMPWRAVIPLGGVSLCLGTVFGASEVVTVAYTEERGHPALAGVMLALWAFGSLVAGVWVGAMHWRTPSYHRVRWGILALAVTLAPLFLVDSLILLGLLLLVGGMSISPTLIGTVSTVEQVVPTSRLTEGLALVHTAMAVGIAPGATVAGIVIDEHGASPAFLVMVAAAAMGSVIAWATPWASATQEAGRRGPHSVDSH